jgi:hypothetical protein
VLAVPVEGEEGLGVIAPVGLVECFATLHHKDGPLMGVVFQAAEDCLGLVSLPAEVNQLLFKLSDGAQAVLPGYDLYRELFVDFERPRGTVEVSTRSGEGVKVVVVHSRHGDRFLFSGCVGNQNRHTGWVAHDIEVTAVNKSICCGCNR